MFKLFCTLLLAATAANAMVAPAFMTDAVRTQNHPTLGPLEFNNPHTWHSHQLAHQSADPFG
jgi:hypothetical protein